MQPALKKGEQPLLMWSVRAQQWQLSSWQPRSTSVPVREWIHKAKKSPWVVSMFSWLLFGTKMAYFFLYRSNTLSPRMTKMLPLKTFYRWRIYPSNSQSIQLRYIWKAHTVNLKYPFCAQVWPDQPEDSRRGLKRMMWHFIQYSVLKLAQGCQSENPFWKKSSNSIIQWKLTLQVVAMHFSYFDSCMALTYL